MCDVCDVCDEDVPSWGVHRARVVWWSYVLFAARAMRQCDMQQRDDAMQQCYMWQCSGAPL